MEIYNSSQKNFISDNVKVAENFVTRSIGLLSKKFLNDGESLIIKPCCSIHTFFMRFAIDVVFVNRKNEVVAVHENVKPWRILPIHPTSWYVIELPAGTISDKNICKKDFINLL